MCVNVWVRGDFLCVERCIDIDELFRLSHADSHKLIFDCDVWYRYFDLFFVFLITFLF